LDPIVADNAMYEIDSVGAFFEVDLEYPEYLHEYFNDLPPAPNVQEVLEDSLSPYQKNIFHAYQTKHNSKTKKLICSLSSKKFYKIHYLELELYINLGVVVTRVHRMVTFTEREQMLDNGFTHNDIEKIKVINIHKFLINDDAAVGLLKRFNELINEKKISEDILDKLDLMMIQKFNLQHSFRSYNQKINTVQIFKAGIGCKDNKRYICPDGNDSYPFGSVLIEGARRATDV
jgi:hypothetical protein